ncbi:MAG TPA: ABC transporter permease [Candidatus Hydrogenedentes bacterium]|nr:ABC transporter permease [Candidatus Hydrogenedentota bacterium]HOV74143.1 ABC transporter permease [Candidatus Hydrogenedentota bacterium]HPC15682.1 ABC transporter permease [Candidatus Hydrogenedentota bacterium]HRT19694.1 ABC transporter permease [Candidatus Hydrogenedentota bacterium]HRT64468.1 ABC transporter permease [Candidatus Hydrogenedentota bacterium]
MRQILARHSPLVILAGLCIVVAVLSPEFRTADNLKSVAYRTAVVGIIATGQILVILTAGIDLSVGSVAALSGVVACTLMKNYALPVPLVIGSGLLTGLACGLLNGFFAAKGRIPPFIVTLGMMMAARGGALLLSGGRQISAISDTFAIIGGMRGWWIPVGITLTIAAVFSVVLTFTRFGRALYAIGGNLNAARLSGIPVDRMRIGAFVLCGMLTGFAGVMLASRTGVASPNAADGGELDAIAACVIGGGSLMGGEGGCVGTLAGALIMNVLVNFCNLKNINPAWQKVLVGALIVILVYYDNLRKRRAGLLKE